MRSPGYRAEIKNNKTSSGLFNLEQLEQIYQLFSSFQTTGQPSPKGHSSSLAYKGNFLKALNTLRYKNAWIVDSDASDHVTDAYNLFSSYSTCTRNIRVKIAYGSLPPLQEEEVFASLNP